MTEATKQQRKTSLWRPVLPIPEGTPPPSFHHTQRGQPLHVFAYRDIEGNELGYVCQFMRSAGGVAQLTRTWCKNEAENVYAWQWKQFEKLRPLYGAERLDPERLSIVLIVADELTARELTPLYGPDGKPLDPDHPFLAFNVVSWPGGRSKIGEVDFSPLKGRLCYIWMPHSAERFKVGKGDPASGQLLPKEKQPWRVAARALWDTLVAFGAVPQSIIEAETLEELPDGWNPVRAMDMGWDLKRVFEWMSAHCRLSSEIAEANRLATPSQASGTPQQHWMRSLLRKDGTGPLLPELHNVRMILSHHDQWKGVIWLDAFAQRVMKGKPPPYDGGRVGEWTDFDDTMATDWLAANCQIVRLKSSLVAEGVAAVAQLNARNPLVDYLQACKEKWIKDGRKERLKTWLRDYLGAVPDADHGQGDIAHLDQYHELVGRMWMRGAVARALKPGCKFDYVLILEGQQGLGKSSALAILGGEWAMDTPFSLGEKEGWETIQGCWIIEIAELDAMNKADVRTAKTFFSRRTDRFRLPWGRRTREFPRTCVFGGTTNENEYFRDRTGNRRYLPVHCRRQFERAALERDRDLLFGEAVADFEAGGRLYFTPAEEEVVRREQVSRMRQDPWFGRIARWLASPERAGESEPITINRLLGSALGMEISRADEHSHATRVGHVLAELGYVRRENKSLPERYYYVKPHGGQEGDR